MKTIKNLFKAIHFQRLLNNFANRHICESCEFPMYHPSEGHLTGPRADWATAVVVKVSRGTLMIISNAILVYSVVFLRKMSSKDATCLSYKHSVFQSEARICLSFSQIGPQNMLRIC